MVIDSSSQTAQLVHAAQAGDQLAFTALYQRYSALVFRTAFLLLGDRGRAEELTQDVFERVYRRLGDYRAERAAFTTWLHQVTVNACLNLRRQRWLGWLSLDRAHSEGLELPAPAAPPLELALRDEQQRRVWQAVLRLPLKLRAAVVLRYYHNLSYEEIAQVLDCPIGTVRSRLHVAHTRLRGELEDCHETG